VHTTTTAKQLGDCQVYIYPHLSPTPQLSTDQSDKETIHTALLAQIEMLESENASLKASLAERRYFRIKDVLHDDKLAFLHRVYIFCSIQIILKIFGTNY